MSLLSKSLLNKEKITPTIEFGTYKCTVKALIDDPENAERAILVFDIEGYPNQKLYMKSEKQIRFQLAPLLRSAKLPAMDIEEFIKYLAEHQTIDAEVEYKNQLLTTGAYYQAYDFNISKPLVSKTTVTVETHATPAPAEDLGF